MAQNYTLMARKNLLKPDETPKYYAVARSGRKVTVKEVCKRITERSSHSKGELEGCIGEFLLEIVNVLEEGNIVQMGDLGNFRMSIKTGTPTDTVKEFKASCIDKGKVLFYPGSDLRKLCNHTIFRHANFIGCLSADKIKMPVRKYFCFNIPVYRNMAEEPSCRSPYHEEYIQTSVSGNSEGLCRSTYSFLSERR